MSDNGVVLFVTIPFMVMFVTASFAFVLVRFLKHRENMTYAKQGMYPPEDDLGRYTRKQPTPSMRRGLILAMIGGMLSCGLATIGIGPWLVGGLIPLGLGIAFMTIGWWEMGAQSASIEDDIQVRDDDPIPPGKITL